MIIDNIIYIGGVFFRIRKPFFTFKKMFRKYIRWPLKRKEPFTENMRNGLFAEESVLFLINVKTSDTVKWQQGRKERNIVVKGARRGTVNERLNSRLFRY